MSGAIVSTLFSAPIYSMQTAGSKGDALIPLSVESPYFVKATAENRGARRSTGIALADYAPRRGVRIQQVGVVDRNVVNLGSGAATWVRVSSAGRLERVISPGYSDDVIGRCDEDGTVTLTPSVAAKPVPPAHYNVRDYGAVGDGTTDDTAAINAAIAAANEGPGTVLQPGQGVVYLPPGRYRVTSQLTTLQPCVWLRGAMRGDIFGNAAVVILSEVEDTLLYLGEQDDVNQAVYNGVENIHFQCMTDSSPATFETDAGACIEVRGAVGCSIRNCTIVGFPIAICLDGAIETHIEDVNIQSDTVNGYSGATTDGKGIWLVDGSTRGRGWTLGGSVNKNVIDRVFAGGNARDIDVGGGIINSISNVNFLGNPANSGVCNLYVEGSQLLSVRRITSEGMTGSGCNTIRLGAGVLNMRVEDSFMGANVPVDVPSGGAVSGLLLLNCVLVASGTNAAISRWAPSAIERFVAINVWQTNVGGVLIDGEVSGGVSYVHDQSSIPYGLGINRANPAQAMIHGWIYDNTKPVVLVEDALNVKRYQHVSASRQEHSVDYHLHAESGATGGGAKGYVETATLGSGAGTQDMGTHALPSGDCLITARWSVQQWRDGDQTLYGQWNRSQVVQKTSGTTTLVGSPTDETTPVNTGGFTAPTLEDDGDGNLVVRVSEHATDGSHVTVVAHYLVTVR